jgi:hypothetical protein
MSQSMTYNGGLTAEQFLFYEIRIVAKMYSAGATIDEIIAAVKSGNLFQYPTERQISRMARACIKRLDVLDNDTLRYELQYAPLDAAKQINLYAMMRQNRLVRDFMVNLVGEKYRQHDYVYAHKDVNAFFSRLAEQNDSIAEWSDKTITKLKQVLNKCLIETEMLDGIHDTTLNRVLISQELERGIRKLGDTEALAAFNCFK